jgi:hypothetical protein
MRPPKLTVVLFIFAAIAILPASAVCSNGTLKGAYGYYHRKPGGGSEQGVVGQIIADGRGTLSVSWTWSFNGAISTGTSTGTYSISSNCTGTLTFNNEDLSPANFSIALDDGARGFQIIQTDSGTAQLGSGVAQGTVTCGLTGKKQTFAIGLGGTLFANSATEAIVGGLILDGKGNIVGSETLSVLGVISEAPVTGTYTQNSDCTGTLQITPKGSTTTNFNTVAVDGGKQLLLIETDNNTLVIGTAQE